LLKYSVRHPHLVLSPPTSQVWSNANRTKTCQEFTHGNIFPMMFNGPIQRSPTLSILSPLVQVGLMMKRMGRQAALQRAKRYIIRQKLQLQQRFQEAMKLSFFRGDFGASALDLILLLKEFEVQTSNQ